MESQTRPPLARDGSRRGSHAGAKRVRRTRHAFSLRALPGACFAFVLACSLVPTGGIAYAASVVYEDESPVQASSPADASLGSSAATKAEIAGDAVAEIAPAVGKALAMCGVPGAGVVGEIVGIAGGLAAGTLGSLAVDSVENISEETLELCEEINEKCDEILVELGAVEDDIQASTAELNASIAQVNQQVSRNELSSVLDGVDNFQITYNGVTNRYIALTQAVQSYVQKAEDGTLTQDDADAVRVAYANVEDFYNNAGSSTSAQFNFVSDLDTQLRRLSPYSPEQALPSDENLNDPAQWGSRTSVSNTLLECVHTYASSGLAFQHQIYAALAAGMNKGASSLYDYLNAYQLYVTFQVQEYNADPALSETDRRTKIQQAWDNYDAAVQKVYRGIDQMYSLYKGEMTTFMRSYDVDQVSSMEYEQQATHTYPVDNGKEYGGEGKFITHVAFKTAASMPTYVVGTPTGKYYMIMQKTGSSDHDFYVCDMIWPPLDIPYTALAYVTSQDFFNLKNSTSPSGFSMVDGADDLSGLYGAEAYAFSQGNLRSYLINQGGLDESKIPASSDASEFFLVMDTLEPLVDGNQYTSYINWLNVAKTLSSSSPSENMVRLDLRADVKGTDETLPALAYEPVLVMLEADGRDALNTTWNTAFGAGGATSLQTVTADEHNNETFASLADSTGASSQLAAGTQLAVKAKPDAGKTLASVTLLDASGQVLDTLYSADEQGEDYLEALTRADDGSYLLYFPQSYQNYTVSVAYADTTVPAEHTVALSTGNSSGILQTQNLDGRTFATAQAGDEVMVYARSYTGSLVDAVSVTAADGSSVAVSACGEDVSVPTPNTVAYTFTMPDQDVSISATYRAGHTVTFSPTTGGTMRFDIPSCTNTSWLYYPVTFDAGDAVTVAAEPEANANTYCSQITARAVSGEQLTLIPNADASTNTSTATFAMPGADVSVNGTFTSLGSALVTLESAGEGGYMRFAASDDEPVNVSQRAYRTGDTVEVAIVAEEGCEVNVSVSDYYGNAVDFTRTDDGITFAMPTSNAVVHADFSMTREIVFDTLGGTGIASQLVRHGDRLARPDDPVRDGFVFAGWFTDRDCTVAYDFSSPVRDSFTLYAKWVAKGAEAPEPSTPTDPNSTDVVPVNDSETPAGTPADTPAQPLARTDDGVPAAPLVAAGAGAALVCAACVAVRLRARRNRV